MQYLQENTCAGVSFFSFLKACNFIKKKLQYRCFPENSATFLKTLILKNICKRLLVKLWPKTPVHRCSVKLLLSNVTFWSPWKHQKTKDFMMFSGWSKRNIKKKWVKTCLTKTLSTLGSSKRLRRLEKD